MGKTPKVTLRIRIKDENGAWKRCKPQFTANGRLKHIEGAAYLLRVNGKFENVGTDPDEALAALKRKEATLLAEAAGLTIAGATRTDSVRRTIAEAATEYLTEVKEQKASETHRAYRSSISLFREFSKKIFLDEIARTELLSFVSHLRTLRKKNGKRRFGERSIHFHLLKAVIFLKASGLPKFLKKNDWPKYSEPPVKFYSLEQVTQLFAAASNTVEWLAVAFLLMTGLRKGEAQHAEFSDVDFAGKVIRVLDKPNLDWHPKTWQCREIPIPDELISAIKALKNSAKSNFIFTNKDGGMSSRNAIYRIIIRVAERAGLECDADCHTFRRTFGTRWVEKAPIQVVQKLMGHKNIETTMRYLGVADLRRKAMRDTVASVFADIHDDQSIELNQTAKIIEMAVGR
jgi:integrase